MSCIYLIKNIINLKIYIGKAASFEVRKKEHLRKLKYNKHVNNYLQNSYNKYGEENFTFEILEECEEISINEREKYWISYHDSINPKIGYNLMLGGEGGVGTLETRNKQSLSQDHNKKKVYGFTKLGVFYKKWESIKDCAKELNANPCDVRRTINQNQYSCKDYILQSIDIFDNRITPTEKVKLRKRNKNGTFST